MLASAVLALKYRPETLRNFAEKFASAGFDESAFCRYGLAESTLAVTFSKLAKDAKAYK